MFNVPVAGYTQQSLISIGTNISSQNASIANASITSLSAVNFKTAVFSPDIINTTTLNVSAINLDPNFVFPFLNVSTLTSIKENFGNLSAVNISANQITCENLQPLLTAGDNIDITNGIITALNNNLPASANFSQLNVSQINVSQITASNLSTGDLQIGQNLTLTGKLLNVNAINSVTAGSSALVTSGAVFNAIAPQSYTNLINSITHFATTPNDPSILPVTIHAGGVVQPNQPATQILSLNVKSRIGIGSMITVTIQASYDVAGNGTDEMSVIVRFRKPSNAVETVTQHFQNWRNNAGGGTRSGTLFPISCTFQNKLRNAGENIPIEILVNTSLSDDIFQLDTNNSITAIAIESIDAGSTAMSLALGSGILSANGVVSNTLNVQPGSGNGFATIGRTFLGNTAFSNMACLSINGGGGADNYGFGQVANNQTIMNAIPGQYNSFRIGNVEVGAYNNIGLGIRLGLGNLPLFPLHVSGSAFIDGDIFTDEIISNEASITNITSSNLSVLNISASNISATTVNISGTLTVNGTPFTTTTLSPGTNITISNNVISAFIGSNSSVAFNTLQVDNDVDIGGSLTVGVTSRFDESLNIGNTLFVGDPGQSEGDVVLFSNIIGNNYASKINSSTLELNCSATGTMNAINYFVKNNKSLTINASGITVPIINVSVLNASNLSTANLAIGQGLETITLFPSQQKLLRLIETPQQGIDRVFAAGFITTKNVTINDFTTTRTLINTVSITTPLINSSVGNFSNISANNITIPSIHATNISSNDLTTNIFTCIDGKATFRFNTPTLNASTSNHSTINSLVGNFSSINVSNFPDIVATNISTLNFSADVGFIENLNVSDQFTINNIKSETGLADLRNISSRNISTHFLYASETIQANKLNVSTEIITGDLIADGLVQSNEMNVSIINVSQINLITDGSDYAMNVSGSMSVRELNVSTALFLKGSDQFFGSDVQAPNQFGGAPRSRINFWSSNASFEVGLRMGINEQNNAILKLEPGGNVGRYNINISNFSTMDMDNASTRFHHPVSVSSLNVSTVNISTINGNNMEVMNNVSVYNNLFVATKIDTNLVIANDGDFISCDATTYTGNKINICSNNASVSNASTLTVTGVANLNTIQGNTLTLPGGTANVSVFNVSLVQCREIIGTNMDFGSGFVSSFKSQLINASTINASVVNGANLSTATMAIGQGLTLSPFQNTLQLTQTPAQAIAELETSGFVGASVTVDSVNTSSLNVDGLATLDAVGVSISLQCPTIFTTTINVSNALNASNINTSSLSVKGLTTLDGSLGIGINSPERLFHVRGANAIWRLDRDRPSPGLQIHRFPTNFVGSPWKGYIIGVNATGPNNGDFFINDYGQNTTGASTPRFSIQNEGQVIINHSLTTPVGNFSTINASSIPGFQQTLIPGNNITIVGNTINSLGEPLPTNPNFSSVTATTGNFSTINASSITGFQPLLTAGANISIVGNTISSLAEPLTAGSNISILNNEVSTVASPTFTLIRASTLNVSNGNVSVLSVNGSVTIGNITGGPAIFSAVQSTGNLRGNNASVNNMSVINTLRATIVNCNDVESLRTFANNICVTNVSVANRLTTPNLTVSNNFTFGGGLFSTTNASITNISNSNISTQTLTAQFSLRTYLTNFSILNVSNVDIQNNFTCKNIFSKPGFSLRIPTGNFSTVNASNIPGFQRNLVAGTGITISGTTISATAATLPTDPNFSSVTATTGNFSTINASSITGFQPLLTAGTNITISGNTISSNQPLPSNGNFSTITATTGNFSNVNASNIPGYQQTLIPGNNITISGNTISSNQPLPTNPNFSSITATTSNISTMNTSQINLITDGSDYAMNVSGSMSVRELNVSTALFLKGSDQFFGSEIQAPNQFGGAPRSRVNFWSSNASFEVGLRMGINEDNNAILKLEPFGNVGRYNINISNFSTMDMDNASTRFHHPVNVSSLNVSTITATTITGFQPLLTAGTNISILNNVISATGGGGGGTSASWSRGGAINGVVVNNPYAAGNIPFSVIQTPEVNCFYNTTNNTIEIQVAGKYLITYGAMSANNNQTVNIILRRNNLIRFKAYSGNDAGFRQVHGSMILDLVVGDFISIERAQGTMIASEEYRYFNGFLIG